jgi:anti-sigma factor RsiW
MTQETQFKLQAYLDGELSITERAEVETLLRQDEFARNLLTELSQTARVLGACAPEIKVPEAREFYWSKIQREIDLGPTPASAPAVSFGTWLRRLLVPAGAVAGLAIAVMLSLPRESAATNFFTASGDAVAFTYENYNTGTTLVWLDFADETDSPGFGLNDIIAP